MAGVPSGIVDNVFLVYVIIEFLPGLMRKESILNPALNGTIGELSLCLHFLKSTIEKVAWPFRRRFCSLSNSVAEFATGAFDKTMNDERTVKIAKRISVSSSKIRQVFYLRRRAKN